MKSLATKDATRRGQHYRAKTASRSARTLGLLALGIGLFFYVVVVTISVILYSKKMLS